MISTLVGLSNLGLGLVYVGVGWMTLGDLRREGPSRGRSHFGLAWIAMAFTCGPHHLEHGIHTLTTSQVGGPLDLIAVAIGLPAATIWLGLRIEARRGGAGDRWLAGTPRILEGVPTLAAAYLLAFTTAALLALDTAATFRPVLLPNVVLVGLYLAVGWVLGRTQLRSRRLTGGWSLSGVCLTLVFPTCALMHTTWIVYVAAGRYTIDTHLLVIDVLSIPAALYFLWVVTAIGAGKLQDWTHAVDQVRGAQPEPVAATPATRPRSGAGDVDPATGPADAGPDRPR